MLHLPQQVAENINLLNENSNSFNEILSSTDN